MYAARREHAKPTLVARVKATTSTFLIWFSCGDFEAVHSTGAVVWLPRGLPHTFQVRSKTARVFQVSTPPQFERLVATLGRSTGQPMLPELEEIDPGHVAEVCRQFGIEVLGPPPEPVPVP